MDLKIAICDDNPTDISDIESTLTSYYIATDTNLSFESFTSGEELLLSYQNPDKYDVLFLDVEMPGQNGIQIAKSIRTNISKNVFIVFVSSYPQYMQDSFRVHPFYYLTKPFTPPQIFNLMDSIIKELDENHILLSFVNTEQGSTTIRLKDVLYIESTDSKGNHLTFHFKDYDLTTKGILNQWNEQLKNEHFCICYRGILVNLLHIHYFDKSLLTLDNGTQIPISRKYEKELREKYLNNTVKLFFNS